MNQVTLLGRSGANAEIKYAQNGTAVLNLSIATSEKQGETWVSTWHKVTVFGKTAENVAHVIHKGSEVFVFGKIVNRKWTDKNGQEKTSNEILASWIRVCESGRPKQQAGTPPPNQEYGSSGGMNESDIPF